MMLEIAIDADEEWDSSRCWEPLVRDAVEAAVAQSARPELATFARAVEVSVLLTSDDEVRRLNAEWRKKDRPTNVLSFPMLDAEELQQAKVDGPEMLLGDIVLAHGVCAAEARDKGVTIEQHAAHLVVHGTLHLLGYDHLEDGEASDMEAREASALERLGISSPYEVTV